MVFVSERVDFSVIDSDVPEKDAILRAESADGGELDIPDVSDPMDGFDLYIREEDLIELYFQIEQKLGAEMLYLERYHRLKINGQGESSNE